MEWKEIIAHDAGSHKQASWILPQGFLCDIPATCSDGGFPASIVISSVSVALNSDVIWVLLCVLFSTGTCLSQLSLPSADWQLLTEHLWSNSHSRWFCGTVVFDFLMTTCSQCLTHPWVSVSPFCCVLCVYSLWMASYPACHQEVQLSGSSAAFSQCPWTMATSLMEFPPAPLSPFS